MFMAVVDSRWRLRETVCGQPCRAVAQPGGAAGDRVGDLGQDIGVVGEAEPFGHSHDLAGDVGGQDAGDLGEFGVGDGPHLLVYRGQFAVAGDLPDCLGTCGGEQAGDDRGRAAHGQQRSFGVVQPPFPRGEVSVDDDGGQRLHLVPESRPESRRTVGLQDLSGIFAGQDR